jgi:hypothetical protein
MEFIISIITVLVFISIIVGVLVVIPAIVIGLFLNSYFNKGK